MPGARSRLYLDGAEALYREMLERCEPRLRAGALIISDNMSIVALVAPTLPTFASPQRATYPAASSLGTACNSARVWPDKVPIRELALSFSRARGCGPFGLASHRRPSRRNNEHSKRHTDPRQRRRKHRIWLSLRAHCPLLSRKKQGAESKMDAALEGIKPGHERRGNEQTLGLRKLDERRR